MEQLPGEAAHPRGLVIKTRLGAYPADPPYPSWVADAANGPSLALRPARPAREMLADPRSSGMLRVDVLPRGGRGQPSPPTPEAARRTRGRYRAALSGLSGPHHHPPKRCRNTRPPPVRPVRPGKPLLCRKAARGRARLGSAERAAASVLLREPAAPSHQARPAPAGSRAGSARGRSTSPGTDRRSLSTAGPPFSG